MMHGKHEKQMKGRIGFKAAKALDPKSAVRETEYKATVKKAVVGGARNSFASMKALDPKSAVRETEYNKAAKAIRRPNSRLMRVGGVGRKGRRGAGEMG